MAWKLKSFASNDELSDQLCHDIAGQLRSKIANKGLASLVVSGGSTPEFMLSKLSQQPLDWSKVVVTLADERWPPAVHADANASLIERSLLQSQAAKAKFVPLTEKAETPFDAEADVNQRLTKLLAWPLSTVVLGMGNDGHTASLFPGAVTLNNALSGFNSAGEKSLCCALNPPTANYQRMTLTAPALLNCRNLILYIRGKQKLKVLEKAIQPGPINALPIRAFLHQDCVIMQIYYSEQ
ncbi:MAG: 6-phosphogluconolactonase [Pseudohongiellaceae bacterium]|jgi:6-phosphogluconolactonase